VCGTQGIAIGGSEEGARDVGSEAAAHVGDVGEEAAAQPRDPDKPPTSQAKGCAASLHASEEEVLKSYQLKNDAYSLVAAGCLSHTKVGDTNILRDPNYIVCVSV
jgi:hypothetical protein